MMDNVFLRSLVGFVGLLLLVGAVGALYHVVVGVAGFHFTALWAVAVLKAFVVGFVGCVMVNVAHPCGH